MQMEETFVINLAYDSESDSSKVDIAGYDFYQNIENNMKKQTNQQQIKKQKKEKCILTNIL